jgi:hypothetical protein
LQISTGENKKLLKILATGENLKNRVFGLFNKKVLN